MKNKKKGIKGNERIPNPESSGVIWGGVTEPCKDFKTVKKVHFLTFRNPKTNKHTKPRNKCNDLFVNKSTYIYYA